MSLNNPLKKLKSDYHDTIEKIKADSNVGIDAQFTHAIIIDYLQQIHQRLDAIEEKLKK